MRGAAAALDPGAAVRAGDAARLAPGDDGVRNPGAHGGGGLGSQPPVVYRALDFLVGAGLVHRIERLAAFAACTHGGAEHNAGFLVCRVCRRVAETALPGPAQDLVAEAEAAGFAIERTVVEAEGVCALCRGAGG